MSPVTKQRSRIGAPTASPWAGPARVWTLALFCLAGAVLCLLSAAFPLHEDTPVLLNLFAAVVNAGFAAGLFLFRDQVRSDVLHLVVGASAALVSAGVAEAATPQGLVSTSLGYVALGMYAGFFFPRTSALVHASLASLGFVTALVLNPLPGAFLPSLTVLVLMWAVALVLSRLVSQLRTSALVDSLTGALNRQGLREEADALFARVDRSNRPLCVVVMDLDGFKQVNDSRGHAAGDDLLVGAVRSWSLQLRSCDVLARVGGDEFVLLLPDVSLAEARSALGQLVAPGLRWSTGVVQRRPGELLDASVDRADRVLYDAKAARATPEQRLASSSPIRVE